MIHLSWAELTLEGFHASFPLPKLFISYYQQECPHILPPQQDWKGATSRCSDCLRRKLGGCQHQFPFVFFWILRHKAKASAQNQVGAKKTHPQRCTVLPAFFLMLQE
jgi:hypothetical protein